MIGDTPAGVIAHRPALHGSCRPSAFEVRQVLRCRLWRPPLQRSARQAVVLDRERTALHTAEMVDDILDSGGPDSTPFR
jgi:hypothetical protein